MMQAMTVKLHVEIGIVGAHDGKGHGGLDTDRQVAGKGGRGDELGAAARVERPRIAARHHRGAVGQR